MSKAKVNAVLKQFGLANVKRTTATGTERTYRTWENKLVKAVKAVNHSPLDVTSAKQEKITKLKNEIEWALVKEFEKRGEYFVVSKNSKKVTYLFMAETQYPMYESAAHKDPGYVATYFVPMYIVEEI